MKKIEGYAKLISKITGEFDIITDIRLQKGFYSTKNEEGIKGKTIYSNYKTMCTSIWSFYPLKYWKIEYLDKKQVFFEMI